MTESYSTNVCLTVRRIVFDIPCKGNLHRLYLLLSNLVEPMADQMIAMADKMVAKHKMAMEQIKTLIAHIERLEAEASDNNKLLDDKLSKLGNRQSHRPWHHSLITWDNYNCLSVSPPCVFVNCFQPLVCAARL